MLYMYNSYLDISYIHHAHPSDSFNARWTTTMRALASSVASCRACMSSRAGRSLAAESVAISDTTFATSAVTLASAEQTTVFCLYARQKAGQ